MSTIIDPKAAKPSMISRVSNCFVAIRICLNKNKIFVEIIGLTVALAVLWTYRRANELTEKQVMAAHVPWLSVKNLNFDVPRSLITYEIENPSDSPAFNFEGSLKYASKDEKVIHFETTTIGVGERQPQFLAPHQGPVKQITRIPDSKAAIVREVFRSRKMTITIIDTYEDIFGRKFRLIVTVEANKENPDDTEILDARIEGIDQIR